MPASDRQSVSDEDHLSGNVTTASLGPVTFPSQIVPEAAPLPSRLHRGRRRATIVRRTGRLLRLLRDHQLYRSLGFVRLCDYVLERLGFSYRTAQELIATDEALEGLPLAAAAFQAGEITEGHARLLRRGATPASEVYWVGLARRSDVRALELAVAAARRRVATRRDPDADGGEKPDADGPSPTADNAFDAGEGPLPAAEQVEVLSIESPAWIIGLWRESVSLVRRLAGSDLLQAACFEMVLAEVAADVGVEGEAAGGEPIQGKATDLPFELQPSAPTVPVKSQATGDRPDQDVALEAADIPDARAIDAELRALVSERQRHEGALAEHLRLVAVDRGYRDAGFTSLEAYAADRFGLSPRSLYYLLALGRVLRALPALRRAFLSGRVTARQAALIGGVASALTIDAWVRRARSVTLRRLEDEISFWIHLKETRPNVWGLLGGGPLPDGIALAPGQPARLHASASRCEGSQEVGGDSAITAEAFLRALEEDESASPLPARLGCIRLRVDPGVAEMWRATVRHVRATVREDLAEWEALAHVLREFLRVWDNSETRRQRRENPTLERDGWRCTAPGCRSIGTGRLHGHHIVFRSEGGALNDPSNVTTLCTGHHLGLLHDGKMRCSGRAPDTLMWELGVETGRRPFLAFRGETRMGGAAG